VRNYGFFIDLGRTALGASGGTPLLRHPFDTNNFCRFLYKGGLQTDHDHFSALHNHFPDFYRWMSGRANSTSSSGRQYAEPGVRSRDA